MYNITAKQIDNDLVLEYWETSEPTHFNSNMDKNNPEYRIWLSHKKTVKVHADYKMELDALLTLIWFNTENVLKKTQTYTFGLMNGISCDRLKDRIEIKSIKMSKITHSSFGRLEAHPYDQDYELVNYAILKPIEPDEETEDKFTIKDMKQAFEFGVNTLSINRSKKKEKEDKVFEKWIKSKFTIKRNAE